MVYPLMDSGYYKNNTLPTTHIGHTTNTTTTTSTTTTTTSTTSTSNSSTNGSNTTSNTTSSGCLPPLANYLPWSSPSIVGIRKSFVAKPGCVLLALDYSQIEMRIAAHLSGDRKFQHMFQPTTTTKDPFVAMAQLLFHNNNNSSSSSSSNDGSVTAEQRQSAKQQSYAWLYGSSMNNNNNDNNSNNNNNTRRRFSSVFAGAGRYHELVKEEFSNLGGIYTLGGHYRACAKATVAYNAKYHHHHYR
jgi:DNA polymerase-1